MRHADLHRHTSEFMKYSHSHYRDTHWHTHTQSHETALGPFALDHSKQSTSVNIHKVITLSFNTHTQRHTHTTFH